MTRAFVKCLRLKKQKTNKVMNYYYLLFPSLRFICQTMKKTMKFLFDVLLLYLSSDFVFFFSKVKKRIIMIDARDHAMTMTY